MLLMITLLRCHYFHAAMPDAFAISDFRELLLPPCHACCYTRRALPLLPPLPLLLLFAAHMILRCHDFRRYATMLPCRHDATPLCHELRYYCRHSADDDDASVTLRHHALSRHLIFATPCLIITLHAITPWLPSALSMLLRYIIILLLATDAATILRRYYYAHVCRAVAA